MRFLRSTVVAAVVAAASALAVVPASAQAPNPIKPVGPVGPIHPVGPITTVSCPADGTLTLYKTADRGTYDVNDVVTFTLKVAAGTCDATGVAVKDQLPTGLTVSSPSVLSHSFGSVAAGTDQSYSFQAVAVAKGTLTNQAQATGSSIGYTAPGPPCGPIILHPATGNGTNSIVRIPYTCPRSSSAQATVTVNAPKGNNPTPTPTPPPGQPTGPATPQLPDTGRQQ